VAKGFDSDPEVISAPVFYGELNVLRFCEFACHRLIQQCFQLVISGETKRAYLCGRKRVGLCCESR
jgi:hypothetical protein